MIRYIKLDETKHWREDIQKKAEKILGVYLYDDGSHTHCCELTPSYALHFVEYQFTADIEDEEKREEMFETMLEGAGETEDVTYVHVSVVDRMQSFPLAGDYDDMEEALEYARGNSL